MSECAKRGAFRPGKLHQSPNSRQFTLHPHPLPRGGRRCAARIAQPATLVYLEGAPFGAREISIERLSLRDGRLERSRSLDVGSLSGISPDHWEQFAAQGDRAIWVAGTQLLVANFASEEPVIEAHQLGPWGCNALQVRDDTAYCARGPAGYVSIELGTP